jgi:hypothetical protein
MDFIPKPHNANHILIPYLGGKYDRTWDFDQYPQRAGWMIAILRLNKVEAARVDERMVPIAYDSIDSVYQQATKFIQTWLFFGFLVQFFEPIEIVYSDLIRVVGTFDGKTVKVLDSNSLPEKVRNWCMGLQSSTDETRLPKLKQCTRLINVSASFLSDTLLQDSKSRSFIPNEQRLCLNALYSYLSRFVSGMSLNLYNFSIQPFNTDHLRLHEEILERGCCPNLLERVRSAIGIVGVYYLDLSRQYLDRKDHERCTSEACVANKIVDVHYQTAHWEPKCIDNCRSDPMIRAVLDFVSLESLQKGRFALLKLGEGFKVPTSDARIILVPWVNSIKYVAISHVWSDGLGNTKSNALPICQLERLAEYLEAATTSLGSRAGIHVWLDTLCVPLQPKAMRKAAIASMSTVYESADFVLVLDETLMKLEAPASCEETLFYIFASPWMTRLWTFQEAWLARSLVFQFEDRSVELGDLFGQARISRGLESPYTIFVRRFDGAEILVRSLISRMQALWPSPSAIVHDGVRQRKSVYRYPSTLLSRIWAPIMGRRTSHDLDMPLCMTAAMGKDVRKILEKEDLEERMKVFWTVVETTTSDVLFLRGPKISSSPFRWAPKDLLNPETQKERLRTESGIPLASITSAGLCIEGLPSFWIDWHEEIRCESKFGFTDSMTGLRYGAVKRGKMPEASDKIDEASHAWTLYSALIVRKPLSSEGYVDGVLLACESRNNQTRCRGTPVMQLSIYQENSFWDQQLRPRLIETGRISKMPTHATARPADDKQIWSIT